MTRHCPRCGLETSRDAWWDRNPVAAAVAAVPIAIFGIAAILTYPWALIPLLLAMGVFVVERRRRQQAAIAARADYENAFYSDYRYDTWLSHTDPQTGWYR